MRVTETTMGSRKDRYRWECTGCGQMIERNRSDRTSKYDAHQLLYRDAVDHLQHCDSARFVDVDDYYVVDACLDPWVRPRVRRRRKLALFRVGNNKAIHIDYGAEKAPCGYTVGRKDGVEVNVTDFYRGLMPKFRLCKTCLAYRRAQVVKEMAVLEAQPGYATLS